ncbi:mechanosensitive ion channel family protein [Trueperella bialowiezensis]|nr:mechanosensitive ion channel family protein [Trueperella bialowiezensis]
MTTLALFSPLASESAYRVALSRVWHTVPGGDVTPPEEVEAAVETTFDAFRLLLNVGIGAVIGLVAGFLIIAVARLLGRRSPYMDPVTKAVARPVELAVAVIGAWAGFQVGRADIGETGPSWLDSLDHIFLICVIILVTWVLVGFVNGVTVAINERMAETSEGRAARVKTQTQILRRVVVAIIWILGAAGVLVTFPGARAAGASIFASAGIVSVVVGLAAQTTLSNVFSGLQLAFTDSIRVGDIVHYQGNYTTVEEITLTYVVLAVWDGRRIIVPSQIMTTESFENWTRRAPEMTGDVLIKMDWQVPIDAARLRLEQILEATDLWDGRTGVLQINDASTTEGVLVRCLISAESSPKLTDLRNHVREEMVRWIQEEAPQAAPHTRIYRDEKGDFQEKKQKTEALVNLREQEKPPVFKPESEEETRRKTLETEVISDDDVKRIRRVPLDERGAQLTEGADAEPGTPDEANGGGDTTETRTTGVSTGPIKSAIFTGSPEAVERAKAYSGPGEKVYEERTRRIEESRDDLDKVDAESDGESQNNKGEHP